MQETGFIEFSPDNIYQKACFSTFPQNRVPHSWSPLWIPHMVYWRCEMKIFPSMLINKKCHSYQWFLTSKCEWGLRKLQSSICCHSNGDCWGAGGMQEAKWTRKQDWPQVAEVHMTGMNSVIPETCIFPYIECQIPYLDTDLWCSNCLLPLLYLYIAWLPLLPSWSTFLRATEMLSPRLRVLNIPTK